MKKMGLFIYFMYNIPEKYSYTEYIDLEGRKMENPTNDLNELPVDKKKHHRGGAWWALILILIGAILVVQNLTGNKFEFNWWALFIFIPVIGSLSTAWASVHYEGRLTAKAGGSLGSAVLVGTVGTILMFGMDWGRWWPLVVMAAGFSMFMAGIGKLERSGAGLSALTHMGAWIGLGAMVLGLGFLAKYMPIPALAQYMAGYTWWAVPIIIVGVGAVINAALLFFENEHQMSWAVWSMLLIAVFIFSIGVLALLKLDMNLLFPIVLIACGLVILVGLLQRK